LLGVIGEEAEEGVLGRVKKVLAKPLKNMESEAVTAIRY
jgi:hypothetical protein